MANTRELRRRIRSVKNTSQITKAMQMVAATKMKRAQNQALSGRPYIEALNYALAQLKGKVDPQFHPLLQVNDATNIGVLLLSTDKGLCGALNTNLFRLTQSFFNEHKNTQFYSVGKKSRTFLARTGKDLKADFENPEAVSSRQARQIAKLLIDAFLNGELKEVFVLYPHFVSTLRQEPTLIKVLPVDPSTVILSGAQRNEGSLTNVSTSNKLRDSSPSAQNDNLEFLFEPTADLLLDFILTHSVETKIYSALLETKASEHSARMIAMQNATDNAKELVEDLTLTYNQTRQQAITNELLEITTAQAALE